MSWNPVCPLTRIPLARGVCVLVDGEQVALFRTGPGRLHALSNRDPASGAMVLSRGIVGSRGDEDVVVSPMYKQAFALQTGRCLDEADLSVTVHDVRVVDEMVEVRLRSGSAAERSGQVRQPA